MKKQNKHRDCVKVVRREALGCYVIRMILLVTIFLFLSNAYFFWGNDNSIIGSSNIIAAKNYSYETSNVTVKENVTDEPIEEDVIQVMLRMPAPLFEPRYVGKQFIIEYEQEQREKLKQEQQEELNNDSPVTREDIERAKQNVVSMLPREKTTHPDRFPIRNISGEYLQQVSDVLMSQFGNFVIDLTYDVAPLFVDYGCRIGVSLARRHGRSTVLCVYESSDIAREFPVTLVSPPRNLIRIVAHNGFLGAFLPFFSSCNFVTVSTVFLPLASTVNSTKNEDELVRLVAHAVHNSGAVLAVLPVKDCSVLLDLLKKMRPSEEVGDKLLSHALQLGSTVKCDIVADFEEYHHANKQKISNNNNNNNNNTGVGTGDIGVSMRRNDSPILNDKINSTGDNVNSNQNHTPLLRLFRLKVTRSARFCRKTWGAPFVQWDRAVLCAYNRTRVQFTVLDVNFPTENNTSKQKKQRLSYRRRIHPLQYVPSVAVDSLLAAGLSLYDRQLLFAAMLTTPRYPDPLPHNWMVGNPTASGMGGRAFRIDRYDERFSAAVAEEQNYWATSTRGYMRLLSHHICLSTHRDGIPLVLYDLEPAARATCRTCINKCSYFPKGSAPCGACVLCAAALARYTRSNLLLEGNPRNQRGLQLSAMSSCIRQYRNYHTARAVWESWRRKEQNRNITL
ncbi:hypothetical protein LSM04_006220 [Trypanosoma melophagium]|uniref:uncharacterized protein n=1 Tax=Trypanosoma melophagium TaxID=715481 RepID=UPI00351A0A7E|nr:hypothetical protein LSM04_006220 [Trypanosoma melophagium]